MSDFLAWAVWRSSIWYLTTWDEKTFWIFPLKDILKKHSVIQRLHQITKKPFLNIRFSGLCSLAGFWADRASAEPFLSFPPSPLFLSVCVRAEETLRGAEWPPSLVKMKNRSAARQNQSWHTTLHDKDAQAVLFFLIKARSDSVPIGAHNRSFHRWARLCSKHGSSFLQCW